MLNSVKNCNKAIYAIYLKPYNELKKTKQNEYD